MTFCFNNNNNLSIFIITTCNITRSPGGEFGRIVRGGFWPDWDFYQRGVLAGGGFVLDPLSMQSCILRRIDCASCGHSSGSPRMLSHTSM